MGLSYAQEYSCRDHFRQRAFERFGVDDQHLNKWINQHLSPLSLMIVMWFNPPTLKPM